MIQQSSPFATTTLPIGTVAREARQLFQRRRIAYIALAAITAGAYLYLATMNARTPASAGRTAEVNVQPEGSSAMSGTTQANTSASASGNANQSAPASNTSTSRTTVTVNGQNIAVPANGTLDTTITGDGSDTSVHISHSASSTGSAQQSSTFKMEVNQ